jgi:hypothetical protein
MTRLTSAAWRASLALLLTTTALARGVSPYLPLQLDPEIERQIERVLILADQPVLTRPIPAALVLDALPAACEVDVVLCTEVRRYLAGFMESSGVSQLQLVAALGSDESRVLPNQRGLLSSNAWQATAGLYWQPNDYLLVNLGGLVREGSSRATGSFVSLGISRAQLDVGYRDHWLSPATDSAFLLSTQAPSTLSATLSNYEPLTRLKLRYQLFHTRLSRSADIEFGDGVTQGRPKVLGTHLSMEPVAGWSLGVSRLLQYGGGARGDNSFEDTFRAFFNPSKLDNANSSLDPDKEFGNQLAAITSRFIFPGQQPFTVYFEYAGEDTSRGRNYLLGNSALTAGVQFPQVADNFDFSYEVSEWQNAWYVNGIYGDGLTNQGLVLGHWAGNERVTGDGVGGQSHMLRFGWQPRWGGTLQLRLRTLANEEYSATDYQRAYDATLRYARPVGTFNVGTELFLGRDVFGTDVSRVALFANYAPYWNELAVGSRSASRSRAAGAELFVETGLSAYQLKTDLTNNSTPTRSSTQTGAHLGLGARRAVAPQHDLGVRIDLDDIDGKLLTNFRAVDYRYRFGKSLTFNGSLGAARYDVATPAYGLSVSLGAQWRDLLPHWDLGMEWRYAHEVARDRLLPEDPDNSTRPDIFYNVSSVTLAITRTF